MARVSLLLIFFFIVIQETALLGQSIQIGIIDFYGNGISEAAARKCLPFVENDTLQISSGSSFPNLKKSIIDCLLGQPKLKQADITLVCCTGSGQKWMIFVGTDTSSKNSSHDSKSEDIRLSEEIISVYDNLMDLVLEAIEKGEASENDTSGHSLMTYRPAQQLQQKFIPYADSNLNLLREVLKKSKHKEHREVAAMVIAYYRDKKIIVKDLLDAVSDEEENVRNNAVRAIGVIAGYSVSHPELNIEIPADPFIDMINSISWTDRNKSSFVLLSLTKPLDRRLLDQLRLRALDPIVDMASWKSDHSMMGYILLGRIAGWPEKEIIESGETDKAEGIKKMLSEINK